MQPISVADAVLSNEQSRAAKHVTQEYNVTTLTYKIDAVSTSLSCLPLWMTRGHVREKAKRFLACICSKITPSAVVREEEDPALDALISCGETYRVAAESLLQEKRKDGIFFYPKKTRISKKGVLLTVSLLNSMLIDNMMNLPSFSSNTEDEDDNNKISIAVDNSAAYYAQQASDGVQQILPEEELQVLSTSELLSLQRYLRQINPPLLRRRMRRGVHDSTFVTHLLNKIYTRKKLPHADRKYVLEPMIQGYQKLWQPEREESKANALMLLDLIALERGTRTKAYYTAYQKIRKALRQRLVKFHHQIPVMRYLNETPPPFAKITIPLVGERILKYYFNATNDHQLAQDAYRGINSQYLDSLILDVCHERFRGISDYIAIPPLNKTHRVIFDISSLKSRMVLIPHYFTTKEIFLGVHKRRAMIQSHGVYFFPNNTDLYLILAVDRKPNITDFIDYSLRAQLRELEKNTRFKSIFESTVYFRAIGLVVQALMDNPDLAQNSTIEFFLRGEIEPLIVTLWGQTVPHLLALSSPRIPDVVYISLALFEVRVFSREQYDDAIKKFIGQHLSTFEYQRLNVSTLRPKRVCHSRVYMHVANDPACFEPVLCVKYDKNYAQALYQALLKQIAQNIDSLTYTNDEYDNDMRWVWINGSLDSLGMLAGVLSLAGTGPVGAAILASIGIGVGLGGAQVNRRMAEQSDNGALYHHALTQARLGLLFTALGSVADVAFGARALLKKFKTYGKTVGLPRHQTGRYRHPHHRQKLADTKRKVLPNNKQKLRKGGEAGQKQYIYEDSPTFRVVKKSINPRIGSVGYRTIGDNSYVHFYTKADKGREVGGKTLLVSAHGGFFNIDLTEQAVVLPESLTVKLLAPHNTFLEDPSLRSVINSGKSFNAFLTIKDGKQSVNFRPQTHAAWRFGAHYEPAHYRNSLGRNDGLHNYRHYHFEAETPEHISEVLIENRWLAESKQATPSDILVVHDRIGLISDTDPAKASVRRVIELDQEGLLVNVQGMRYNTIIFSHCRANFLRHDWMVSTYQAVYPNPSPNALHDNVRSARLIRSTLHRENVSMPFIQRDEDMGEIAFYPVTMDEKHHDADSPVTVGESASSEVSR